MSEAPHERLSKNFRRRLAARDLPVPSHNHTAASVGLTRSDLLGIFESQLMSRHLDYAARRLGAAGKGFYSIGSAGHEGNAGIANVFRTDDIAFLHYRSGAFLIERQRKRPGSTPLWDMALSFVASREDPVSGGRHKVLGSHDLLVPPQTSTIASHLPKAVGAGYSIALAKALQADFTVLPHDSVALVSFGDASANHSTALGALNGAALTAFRGLPLPLVFVCEDNGIGISVPSPTDWVAQTYANRAGLHYLRADGTELLEVVAAAREAEQVARRQKRVVFLHLTTVRLMGHAGSDVEAAYRSAAAIAAAEAQDPLLKTARSLIDEGVLGFADVLELDLQIEARVARVTELASQRPKLSSTEEVMRAIVPAESARYPELKSTLEWRTPTAAVDRRAVEQPQHLSRLISLTLAGILADDPRALIFGEDVGKKGGVYGATTRLQTEFGPRRVFDTHLDEQSILGLAIGMAQNGFVPIPEIQFLAYVHNAEDQIRGEASTLPFFSDGKAANPMVIRIAGLAYQRGFGGHFHNDNAIGVFRDIPGLILACPSRGDDAVRMLRGCYRLAREQGRVVIFLEPIALYNVKDLHADGDGALCFSYRSIDGELGLFDLGIEGPKDLVDVAILTYGNGAHLSRQAIKRLQKQGTSARLIDLRWLKPLDMAVIKAAIEPARCLLIVDECRRTGSLSEELLARLVEEGFAEPLARHCAEDSFIPLGQAAYQVLPSIESIVNNAQELLEGRDGA